MWRGLLLVVLVGSAFPVIHLSSSARAAFPGGNGLIAFESNRGGCSQGDIYVMQPDGGGRTRLTSDGASGEPAWSPDGQEIAFARNSGNGAEIWVMNADGSGQTRLTLAPTADDFFPAWSPDGSKIAFARYGSETHTWDIWVMNADGNGQTNITNSPAVDINPAWQPGGSRIAFETNRDGNAQIYAMNPDGSGLTDLSNNPSSWDSDPDWSPDGSRIAFYSNRETPDYGTDVYVMNADGSGVKRLTSTLEESFPAWSPNGSKILFSSRRDFNNTLIYAMNADGGSQSQITDGSSGNPCAVEDRHPDWQPTAAATQTTLTVVKHLVPTTDPGHFNLLIDGVAQAVNVSDNGTTGAVTLSPGSHTVSERAGVNTVLDKNHYVTSIACSDGSRGGGTALIVSVPSGAQVTCTITNVRKLRRT